MPAKRVLPPVKILQNQSLSADFISPVTEFPFLDNISYQVIITTSDSTGSFEIQGSLDYVPDGKGVGPANPGHWAALTLSGFPTANGANDTILININECPYQALRVAYNSTVAGTGSCDIVVMAKEI